MAEGSPLQQEHVDAIVSFAKEHGLSQDAAQALVDRESNAAVAFRQAEVDAYEQQAKKWQDELLADKELGGTPEKVAETVQLANRAFKEFGSLELGQMFAKTSLGNNPELIRFAVRIAKAFGDDRFVTPPKGGASTRPSDSEVFYPSTTSTGDKK